MMCGCEALNVIVFTIMGCLKRRSKFILSIAVIQICQSSSYGFSAFSSRSANVPKTNSTELMDLKASLIQDFPDATNAEVDRFTRAYSKNGKGVEGQRQGEETYHINAGKSASNSIISPEIQP